MTFSGEEMNDKTRVVARLAVCAVAATLLVGCASAAGPGDEPSVRSVESPREVAHETSAPAETDVYQTSIGDWSIGMSESDLLESLDSLGITYEREIAEDRQPLYLTDDVLFGMSGSGEDSSVVSMNVISATFQTSLGVQIGDSSSKVERLYGDGYNDDEDLVDDNAWEYSDGDVYLRFLFDDDENLSRWAVATYSLLDL